MSEKEEVLPLPDMPQSQQGTSTATGKGYTASVSSSWRLDRALLPLTNLFQQPAVISRYCSHFDDCVRHRCLVCAIAQRTELCDNVTKRLHLPEHCVLNVRAALSCHVQHSSISNSSSTISSSMHAAYAIIYEKQCKSHQQG
jgi:hypothetical protein